MLVDMILFVTPLAFGIETTGGHHPLTESSDKDVVIEFRQHGLWRSAEHTTADHIMKCGSFTTNLSITRVPSEVKITSLSLNGRELDEGIRTRIENGVNALGGFAFPYVVCNNEKIFLHFDRISDQPESIEKSYEIELD